MTIHIFYRHYNNANLNFKANLGRPTWFSYEKCFQNFISTIKDHKNILLTVIMDGSTDNDWIGNYKHIFNYDSYNLLEFQGGSDELSSKFTYNYIKQQFKLGTISNNDLIYFVENDYLHTDNWIDETLNLFSTYANLHYVSLYDHNDKYFPKHVNDMISRIYTTSTHHWRTISSTCGTYIVRADLFSEDIQEHINIVGDHNKWVHLNQTKQRFILTPIPGLSTHCMEGLMSPTIDWKQINN
jgi:hypothetical protein